MVKNCKSNTKELAKNRRVYETWDLKIQAISPRTILYDLPPIGIGTPEVESLTGYISRLAQEHRLSPVILLKESTSDLSELPYDLARNSISGMFARVLNGNCRSTESIINILQKATHRSDISFISLMNWKYRLSNHRLLKKYSAWCSQCFNEQQEKGIVYEKLIWCVHQINICHTHELPLIEQCPHCDKKLKVLSGKSRPGYCSACQYWLGSNLVQSNEFRNFQDDNEKKNEIWKAIKIGEFISGTPFDLFEHNVKNQKENCFIQNLSRLIKIHYGGNINEFACKIGICHARIRGLLAGEVLPNLEIILKISAPLNLSPSDLFRPTDSGKFEGNISPTIKKIPCKEEMNDWLKDLLREQPPLSAKEVSKRIKWTTAQLQKHFPIEYGQLIERYAEHKKRNLPDISDNEVKLILLKASTEEFPQSLQSVFRKIGCENNGKHYYRKFPGLCLQIVDRFKMSRLKRFDIPNAEKIMISALEENPPPSFSEIVRRARCPRASICEKLPELSKSLKQRYEDYITKSKSENLKLLREEIKKAIMKLLNENSFVSMNRVKAILPRKWNESNFMNAYQEIIQSENWK